MMFWTGFAVGAVVGAIVGVLALIVWAVVKLAHDVAEHERNQP